jgi:hypothetical protein
MNRFLVVVIAVWFSPSGPLKADTSYGWPLDAPPALTSTYAEYRSGRFHAGLDVKTWGKEGYTCLAVADGYVSRIRTSPWGYGKAVYIRLADGNTAVYAHLSGFVDAIEDVVAEEQDRRGAYSVNLYLPPGQLPVRRGEPVAFSGSTGSGYPHLHFEIRDAKQRPLNPLLNGFDVTDTTKPTVVEVAFLPMDRDARVNGRAQPHVQPTQSSDGKSRFGTVFLWGRVGVAVKAYDRADASVLTNKLAPYRLTMYSGDEVLFRTTYDAFSYDQIYQVDLDRNFVLNRQGRRGFHNLYRKRGNSLPLYDGREIGAGVIVAGTKARGSGPALDAGQAQLSIVAEDASGNRTIVAVDVKIARPAEWVDLVVEEEKGRRVIKGLFADALKRKQNVLLESSTDGGKSWDWISTAQVRGDRFAIPVSKASGPVYRARTEDGSAAICAVTDSELADDPVVDVSHRLLDGRVVLTISSSEVLSRPPGVKLGERNALSVHAVTPEQYEAVVPTKGKASVITVVTANSGGEKRDTTFTIQHERVRPAGGLLVSADGIATARFDPAGVYHAFEGRITPIDVPPELPQPIGSAYRFEPDTIPFREMAQVHLSVPAGTDRSKLGVYELTNKGWSFVWNDVDTSRNTVGAGVRHFSVYALFEDRVPPEVEFLEPAEGATTGTLPEIRVALRDSLSGIPMEELISFELDKHPMIFEYDPEEDVAKGILRGPLGPGPHRLDVLVRDTNGNETSASVGFVVESD